jgi:cation diffusion facilitator CzcD-associated flavoprotein CzcO
VESIRLLREDCAHFTGSGAAKGKRVIVIGTGCSAAQFVPKIAPQCGERSSSVNSWYKNSAGRVTQNWPGTHREWWEETLAPDPNDFLLNQ